MAYMLLQTLLCQFIFIRSDVSGHPFAFHDLLVRFLIVLRLNEFDNNFLQFVRVCFDWSIFYVHFVCGEAQIWIEHQRCG